MFQVNFSVIRDKERGLVTIERDGVFVFQVSSDVALSLRDPESAEQVRRYLCGLGTKLTDEEWAMVVEAAPAPNEQAVTT